MNIRRTAAYLLWPLTIWYAVGVGIRNLLYGLGLKKQESPHITTIGIGNLCTGGSGKTPMTEYLLTLLEGTCRTAMLSRGYRRKSKGYQQDDGSHDAARLGDEAAMVAARHPGVQVAVCERRCEGIRRLMQLPEGERPELVVMDDVYQHRHIKPNINILLTDYRHPYYTDRILPYGNLREFRSARYRAGVVIVTKSPAVLNPVERHNIEHDLKLKNYQKVFFSYLAYGPLQSLDGSEADPDLGQMDSALVVAGIADPAPLLEEVRRHCKARLMAFDDHHDYTRRDIERIGEAFNALPGERKLILTTAKDAVKLQHLADGLPVYVQPVSVAFHREADADFDHYITSTVKENISFLGKLQMWS